jgi:hypothetical protein
MDIQDGPALTLGWEGNDDLAVEAARPQQGRVQGLGAVGGRHDDHPGGRVEAVHLRQHLVQGLVPLIVGDQLAAAALADGVDLVDEDDRGGPLARLHKQIPDPGRPDPDEHLHKRGAGDRDERHVGLAGDRPGQQSLAGPGGADHQHALGADGPGPPVAVGVLEEVDHLGDLAFGPLIAGHIGKGRLRPLSIEHLGPRPADPPHPGQLAAGRAAQVDEDGDEEQQRQQAEQHRPDRGARADRLDLDVVVVEELGELVVLEVGRIRRLEAGPVLELALDVAVGADLDRLHLAGGDLVLQLGRVREVGDPPLLHLVGEQQQDHAEQQPDREQPAPPARRGRRGRARRTVGRRARLRLVAGMALHGDRGLLRVRARSYPPR